MKYTVVELADILGMNKSVIWSWINTGIISVHPNRKGEKVYLKAEKVAGRGQGGYYYLIDANDVNNFMNELYLASCFYKWFRK